MSTAAEIIQMMPERYKAGSADAEMTYYFSIGDTKATVFVAPGGVRVEQGKAVEQADCVLKTTEKIFIDVVTRGKTPGALDIARGRFKTNNPGALLKLRELFNL